MSGNVAEWTNDWYDTELLQNGAEPESQGAGTRDAKKPFVVAGGSIVRPPCGLLNEMGLIPAREMNWLGFRCARDVKDSGNHRMQSPQQTSLQ